MFVMSFITLLQGKGILLFPCFFKEKHTLRIGLMHNVLHFTAFCFVKCGILRGRIRPFV